jgi:hypothetical protein
LKFAAFFELKANRPLTTVTTEIGAAFPRETRLRTAEVSFEDRQDLLEHKSGKFVTHYSESEIVNLIQASAPVCREHRDKLWPTRRRWGTGLAPVGSMASRET